jgi:hypothetical protein
MAVPLVALAAPGVRRPLIVGLTQPVVDTAALQLRLRATARVPIEKLNELSPTQFSVTLRCTSVRQCDAAQARLAAATDWVKSVDVDAVRTRPTPTLSPTSRPASAAAARNL